MLLHDLRHENVLFYTLRIGFSNVEKMGFLVRTQEAMDLPTKVTTLDRVS